MGLLRRLVERIDENLHGDRHLQVAIPQQRLSISPETVINEHLPSRFRLAQGPWPCCADCQAFSPVKCAGPHWTPCPAGPDCEPWDDAS